VLVAAFKQAMFGRKSEKLDPDQFELALEDIEVGIASIEVERDTSEGPPKPANTKSRSTNRGTLPKHLPRIKEIIEPERRGAPKRPSSTKRPLYRSLRTLADQTPAWRFWEIPFR